MKRKILSRTGTVHFVRNKQREYKARRRRNVPVTETLCGRHVEAPRAANGTGWVCGTCMRIAGVE